MGAELHEEEEEAFEQHVEEIMYQQSQTKWPWHWKLRINEEMAAAYERMEEEEDDDEEKEYEEESIGKGTRRPLGEEGPRSAGAAEASLNHGEVAHSAIAELRGKTR